ncbi:hypothetical protein DFQ26_003563 [Actinomortierella ambigua]|nr:hypothetical protein DFQ26_003563 [Actinomortierella ambigua]
MLGKHASATVFGNSTNPQSPASLSKYHGKNPGCPILSATPTLKRKSVSGNRALWSGFLKRNYTSLKEDHPDWAPKDIRAHVGKLWAASPENPKNH